MGWAEGVSHGSIRPWRTMKLGLGLGLDRLTGESLGFASQLDVTHIIVCGPRLGERGILEYEELVRVRKFVESYGMTVGGIENLPLDHWDKVLMGKPGRDVQVRNVCRSIENMGRAGIPILGYYFGIPGVDVHWRLYESGGGRGGAGIKSFDYDLVKNAPIIETGQVSGRDMWTRLRWFLERVVPVAERVGVKLAAHPDDPPVKALRGAGRLLASSKDMARLIETVSSPCNGLEFCQGTVAEMGPEQILDVIREFGGMNKIFYVHFRNTRGSVPKFDEVFIDEGDVDMLAAIRAYKEVGFDGVLIPDHTPFVEGDIGYRYRGMAHALGYMKGLMKAVGK